MSNETAAAPNALSDAALIRAGIGLIQSVALYLLFDSATAKTWPFNNGPLFSALVTVFLFAPLIAVSAMSHLRPRRLIGWTLTVAVIGAALGWHNFMRDPSWVGGGAHFELFLLYLMAFGFSVFIAHCLIVAGSVDRRFVATYATYFDISWKHGVQLTLAAAFIVALWLLLVLGAGLFNLIGLGLFLSIIKQGWFLAPVATLAVTCALHITDARAGIVRSLQTLGCNLLSWLLPLMALICAIFLLSLAFTGLEPLWNTWKASNILLVAAASLVLLINAAYQDGPRVEKNDKARVIALPLGVAILVASVSLVPLAGLAAYGISLRVNQYGWSPDRVIAAAGAGVIACYAIGYAFATARWKAQFHPIEATNVAIAVIAIVVLIGLLTPIADPARISVASQIARLNSGTISPEDFDYAFLRFDAGRYGKEALQELAERDPTSIVATRAHNALTAQSRYKNKLIQGRPEPMEEQRMVATAADRREQIKVTYPSGASLPQTFLDQDWSKYVYSVPTCLLNVGATPCEAVIVDLNNDAVPEIMLLPPHSYGWTVFGEIGGRWHYRGGFVSSCRGTNDAIAAGRFEIIAPVYGDIKIGDRRLHLEREEEACGTP